MNSADTHTVSGSVDSAIGIGFDQVIRQTSPILLANIHPSSSVHGLALDDLVIDRPAQPVEL